MSGQSITIPPIPRETERTAKAIFGRGNFYIVVGENLKTILEEVYLEHLFEEINDWNYGKPILPFITYFQFIEGLTDVQATDAIRTRIEWKYALHLPVNVPVLQESVLCHFRQMLWNDLQGQSEFQKLTDRLSAFAPPHANMIRCFADWEILSVVCSLNGLNMAQEAFSRAIEVLANRFPEWLVKIAPSHWYGRYNHVAPGFDSSDPLRQQKLSLQAVEADIHYLLEEVSHSNSSEISALREIKGLHHIRQQQIARSDSELLFQRDIAKWNGCDSCAVRTR